MTQVPRIYVDNAATSWPKPEAVLNAITHFYRDVGAAAGRGGSGHCVQVNQSVASCRNQLAQLLNVTANQIIFCFNGTDGLNLAIQGLIRTGDHVVTSTVEHNSVLRPLNHLVQEKNIQLTVVPSPHGVIDVDALNTAMTSTTRLCCVSHISNVTGAVQPLHDIATICKQKGAMLLVDACQSWGHVPFDFQAFECDVAVGAGHKGLLGPLGTGAIALSARAGQELQPWRLGGTGTQSESVEQPTDLPFRLEAGNLNVGGILGLQAGIEHIAAVGAAKIAKHELDLRDQLINGLMRIPRIDVLNQSCEHAGVLSFNLRDQDPQTVAAILDSEFGIQTRAGLHCAPLIHQALKTFDTGGTVRISPGIFNTAEEIEYVISAVGDLAKNMALGS